jgi:hypothetical protein
MRPPVARCGRRDCRWNAWIGPDWRNWPQRACVGAPLAAGTLVEIVVTAAVKR